MALYQYKGIKSTGKKTSGYVAAHTAREAERNVELLAVREFKIKKLIGSLGGLEFILFKNVSGNKLSKRDQAYFFEQLSFLLKSGLPLFESIDTMSRSTNQNIAKLAVKMKPSITSGLSLDEAMRKTGYFTYDTIAKVAAGRNGGNITSSLDDLAKKLKESVELRTKVISSLTYPCFMVVMLVAVLILMLTVIIPSIGGTIKQLGGEMPQLTVIIMSASDFLVQYGLFIVIALALLIGTHIYFVKNFKPYRYAVHSLIYKLPLAGKLVYKLHLQALVGTMSQLLISGVTEANALAICAKITPNLQLQDAIHKTHAKLTKEGYDLYSSIESTKFFPVDFTQMIMIGSKSGNLTGVLDSIADQYALEVQESLKRITSLVEPIAIILTAVVGGVCVIAMYLPMFSVFEAI